MLPLVPMKDQQVATVPRIKRDEVPPSAPLDPYVSSLLRWIADQERGVNPNTIAKLSANALNWPLPFAEAVVTAARARRVLTLFQATSRGGYRATLSARGQEWLERSERDTVHITQQAES